MLANDICQKARLSRDSRFDGKFFTAVLTTGIFCRPICPARAPKEQNVRYYANAEQALNAGFTPCKRCLPELAPNTPLPINMQHLIQSYTECNSVHQLAEKFDISVRHVHRLFQQHLGMSPSAYLLHQRLLLVRNLLRNSNLSITDVAYAAGFQSIRRFNEVVKQQYQLTPSALKQQLQKHQLKDTENVQILLSYRPPFCWQTMISFFKQRQIHQLEQVTDQYWRRVFANDQVQGYVEVTPHASKHALILKCKLSDYRYLQSIIAQVRRVFDLDADMAIIQQHLTQDPILADSIAHNQGLRLPGSFDLFEFSIRAILGQQVSVKAATTLAQRITERYGSKAIENPWGLTHCFPSAMELKNADYAAIGLTQARINTLKHWVEFYLNDGEQLLNYCTDINSLTERLLTLPGIGPWTINYLAMRGLSDPDAFPSADLGIIKALTFNGNKPNNKTVLQQAEQWRPWRAYAALYLWHKPSTKEQ